MELSRLENQIKTIAKGFFLCAFALSTTVACGKPEMKQNPRGGARMTDGTPAQHLSEITVSDPTNDDPLTPKTVLLEPES